jgi:hypothetical protein
MIPIDALPAKPHFNIHSVCMNNKTKLNTTQHNITYPNRQQTVVFNCSLLVRSLRSLSTCVSYSFHHHNHQDYYQKKRTRREEEESDRQAVDSTTKITAVMREIREEAYRSRKLTSKKIGKKTNDKTKPLVY